MIIRSSVDVVHGWMIMKSSMDIKKLWMIQPSIKWMDECATFRKIRHVGAVNKP